MSPSAPESAGPDNATSFQHEGRDFRVLTQGAHATKAPNHPPVAGGWIIEIDVTQHLGPFIAHRGAPWTM